MIKVSKNSRGKVIPRHRLAGRLSLIGRWSLSCHRHFLRMIAHRASYKEFGHSHWWELIEIFVPKFGIWFSSLFPKWELIPTGIPTGRNWLKYLNQSFSLTFKQDWELIEFNFPTLGIGWNFCSHFWELIQKKNPTSGNWLTFFIPKNGIMGKWDCCKKPW